MGAKHCFLGHEGVQGLYPRYQAENNKAEEALLAALCSVHIHSLPLLSKVQWGVCPEQPERVRKESCLYLRTDWSKFKHFLS